MLTDKQKIIRLRHELLLIKDWAYTSPECKNEGQKSLRLDKIYKITKRTLEEIKA